VRTFPFFLAVCVVFLTAASAGAQQTSTPPQEAPPATPERLPPPELEPRQQVPPEGEPSPGAIPGTATAGEGALLDGHIREGAFLAGPGSLTSILNQTLLGAGAGLALTGIPNRFALDQDSRTAMLLGTLLGAGVGFGASAWYQFNHWMDQPVASLALFNTFVGGMFATGVVNLFSDDPLVLASSAIIGAELGSWLTVGLGGGELPASTALLVGSGGTWGLIYGALIMATLATSGTRFERLSDALPPLLIAPAIGAGAMALAATRFRPTSTQILRADAFGAVIGGGVLLVSALVAGGFQVPIPYILGIISSAGAMTAVSLLWEESAERPTAALSQSSRKSRPYRGLW
jgi:hypothetical protein